MLPSIWLHGKNQMFYPKAVLQFGTSLDCQTNCFKRGLIQLETVHRTDAAIEAA